MQGRSRLSRGRVHPHVERTVPVETEAALRLVELRRGNAEVEQDAADRAAARAFAHDLPKIGKRRVDDLKPHFPFEAPPAGFDRLRVPVEREHAAFSTQGL